MQRGAKTLVHRPTEKNGSRVKRGEREERESRGRRPVSQAGGKLLSCCACVRALQPTERRRQSERRGQSGLEGFLPSYPLGLRGFLLRTG